MVLARILVELPDGRWKADVTRDFPEIGVCLLSTMMVEERAVEVVTLSNNSVQECLCAIETHSDVAESTVVQRAEREVTVQVETVDPVLLAAANRSATPLTYPLTIHDGCAFVDVVGTHDSISAFGSQLEAADLHFEVSSLRDDHGRCRVLTERQQEFLLAAIEHGYYETPRRCSLTELADEMGVAKSTCSGMLRRTEAALVEYFLTNHSVFESTVIDDHAPGEMTSDVWVV